MSDSNVENRLRNLETALAQHALAIQNLAAKRQLNHLVALMDKRLAALEATIAGLETQIAAINSSSNL